jgi:hypothetical protein
MYESKAEQAEIRATRKDWTVLSGINHNNGKILFTVRSLAGWGNAGVRDFAVHSNAARARVRTAAKKAGYRDFRLEVVSTYSYGDGVMHAITYGLVFPSTTD